MTADPRTAQAVRLQGLESLEDMIAQVVTTNLDHMSGKKIDTALLPLIVNDQMLGGLCTSLMLSGKPAYMARFKEIASSREYQPNAASETESMLTIVRAERDRQRRKWGIQSHSPLLWMVILGEEVGETAREALKGNLLAFLGENSHTATVSVAAMEAATRQMQGEKPYTDYEKWDMALSKELCYLLSSIGHACQAILENKFHVAAIELLGLSRMAQEAANKVNSRSQKG